MNKYKFTNYRFFEVGEYKFKILVDDASVESYYTALINHNIKILKTVKEKSDLEKAVVEGSKELINTILKDNFFDKIFEACNKDVRLINIFVLGLIDFIKKIGV